jgi:hypothetical protein
MVHRLVVQVCERRFWLRNPRPEFAGEKLQDYDKHDERAKRGQDRPQVQHDARLTCAKDHGV